MFNKKPRRNFRQRKETSSDEEEEQKDNNASGEAEKGVPVVNKPLRLAQNRGITCTSKRESTPSKQQSSDEEGGETLELAKDIEEQKKEKNEINEKTNSTLSFSDDKEADEHSFKLKKPCEKVVFFQVRKKETLPAKSTHKKDEGQQVTVSPPALPHTDLDSSSNDEKDDEAFQDYVLSPAPSSASDSSCSTTNIFIPNAEEIQAARRQRSAIRAQKEFIPLSKDGRSSAGSTPDHYRKEDDEDRVNEDDDDDEPDDYERRIEFAPRLKTIKERIAEKLGSDDESRSGSDAEEQKLWEETQIGKGVKRRPGDQSPSGSEYSSHSSRSSSSSRSKQNRHMQKKRSAGVRVPKTSPPVSVSLVKKRITGRLDSLKEVFRARQAEMRRIEGDVESAKAMMESFEESSPEKKLKFYRDMTFYAHNLVECLREKVVQINSLELELHSVLSEHTEALFLQRRQRIKETANRLQQLSYSTDAQGEIPPVKTETRRTDFGEPGNTELLEEEEEEELLKKKKDEILLRSQEIFSDVQDEFCDVKKILSRFEEWRGFYSDSYYNAYISLCLPKLLNPIIRHQLLAWNPLRDTTADLEGLPWFTAVETFCHGHGHEELEHTDRQMLSTIIEKSVLPKMTAYVQLAWDPESSHQSVCLTNICHKLKEDYCIFEGEHSKPVKAFLESVVERLKSCVDEDIFIPLYPTKFLCDQLSPQCQFRDQQFWTAIKLFRNMGKWDLLLPELLLKELMLDKLLNRYLMITLSSEMQHSGAFHAARKIADGLPSSWLSGQTSCLSQFNNFRNFLVQKIHSLCKDQSPEEPNTRSAVVEVLQILSRIRCNDSIMAVAGKYHLEEVVYSQQLLNQEVI